MQIPSISGFRNLLDTKSDIYYVLCFRKERLPLEEVFEQLRTSRAGLTSEDAEVRVHIFGQNKLEEKPVSTHTFGYIDL